MPLSPAPTSTPTKTLQKISTPTTTTTTTAAATKIKGGSVDSQSQDTEKTRIDEKLKQEKADLEKEMVKLAQEKATLEKDKSTLRQENAKLEQDKAKLAQEKTNLTKDNSKLAQDYQALERKYRDEVGKAKSADEKSKVLEKKLELAGLASMQNVKPNQPALNRPVGRDKQISEGRYRPTLRYLYG